MCISFGQINKTIENIRHFLTGFVFDSEHEIFENDNNSRKIFHFTSANQRQLTPVRLTNTDKHRQWVTETLSGYTKSPPCDRIHHAPFSSGFIPKKIFIFFYFFHPNPLS